MVTKTAAIVKAVILMTGRGHRVFNDKLVDGQRSLKVWGWTHMEYSRAASMLADAGCDARVVAIGQDPSKLKFRMHVYE